jgi:hypothetical protein
MLFSRNHPNSRLKSPKKNYSAEKPGVSVSAGSQLEVTRFGTFLVIVLTCN